MLRLDQGDLVDVWFLLGTSSLSYLRNGSS